ncbi:MAG TPA: hypothetical protein VMW54_14080 [Terriglobia bacterium]|nr:hypothetical protein [Terriglobia bacterium]
MNKTVKAVLFAAVLATGIGLSSISSFGTMDIAKKEKVACTTCHVKMGSKELNAVGKCYEKSKNLKKCEAKAEQKKK